MSESLDFWFDFNSPWCYLAGERIGDLARSRGLSVRWRPIHLANLIDAVDGRRPLESNPSFVSWYRQDLLDWSARQGINLTYYPGSPLRPSRALRAALAADDAGMAETFVRRVMRGYWAAQTNIEELDQLAACADEVGLDRELVIRSASEDAYKLRLNDNLKEAVETGIFGLPSIVISGKIYFGNDRLELLERHLDENYFQSAG